MKKIGLFFLAVGFLVVNRGAAAKSAVPNSAYYVYSNNSALRVVFGVNHRFGNVFSTELSSTQLGLLKRLGVQVKPVPVYALSAKPTCNNNGLCEPDLGENPSCPDCKNVGDDPTPSPSPESRSCYPASQFPWGVTKVNGGSGGSGSTVAVLDTGVDQDHLDLVENIVGCETKVTHMKPDMKSCEDGHGHGTHVAGTVAANGGLDGLGVYGVAPETSLLVIKVCDKRAWCYGDDIAAGIHEAADRGANVVSMSFGGDTPDPMIKAAVDTYPEILFVAAAGNNYQEQDSMIYPAAYPEVMGISAIQEDETLAGFSSVGISDGDNLVEERELDLAAPGAEVESTWNDGCYHVGNGTSMAAPHVSGLAAKLWQGSALTTRDYLDSSEVVKDLYDLGHDQYTGFGLPIAFGQ